MILGLGTRTGSIDSEDLMRGKDGSDDEEDVLGFSGMRNSEQNLITSIEKAVTKQLRTITRSSNGIGIDINGSTAQDSDDDDDDDDGDFKVEGFVSHQLQYKQTVFVKKLQLYEKQLQHRTKQLEKLQQLNAESSATIQRLQHDLQRVQEEFAVAQEDWEDEKEAMLRFRGVAAGNNTGNSRFQFMNTGGGATRNNRLKELESQQQRDLRMQMLNGAAEAQEQIDADLNLMNDVSSSARGIGLTLKRLRLFLWRRLYPFNTDIRRIEAQFGYSVASYFRFFRWIITSFIVMCIPCCVQQILHLLYLIGQDAIGNEITWTKFYGIAPRFLLFPGYYPDEAFMYSTVLIAMEFILVLFTIRKWITEDRISKTIMAVEDGSKQPKYSKIILNGWDFSLTTAEQVSDLKKALAEQIKLALEEEKVAERLKSRSKKERYKLYARRVCAFVLYAVVQASSWYLIIVLTTQSSQIQLKIANTAAFLAPYVSSIVPAVVTVINSALPTIISLLTAMEKWDSVGFAIKAMVTRLYLAKILNVLIQLASYALLLDPYLLTSTQKIASLFTINGVMIRKNIMLEFKPETYECRASQVAAGLLTLVVTDFTVSKTIVVSRIGVAWITIRLVAYWHKFQAKRDIKKSKNAIVVPMNDSELTADSDVASVPNNEESLANISRPASAATEAPAKDGVSQDSVLREKSSEKKTPLSQNIAGAPPSSSPASHTKMAMPKQISKSEFLVPQKMVALLYSCTIALVAIPLAPTTALLALGLHVLNFKFDKLILMHFQKKPVNPWSAKDAGIFFIKFYFCTIIIFLICAHYLLLSKSLPKECALQDSLLENINDARCKSNSYNSTTELCILNVSHPSSEYFLDVDGECFTGYPHCICTGSYACGPFVTTSDGFTSVYNAVTSVQIVSLIYELLVKSQAVLWVLLFLFVLALFFLRNSFAVYMMITVDREQQVALTFMTLQKKIKQLETRLHLHKITTGAGDAGDSNRNDNGANATKND